MPYNMLQINKMIQLANDNHRDSKKRQHPDFQFKPSRVGELLSEIGAPHEVVLAGIGNQLLDNPSETSVENLREDFGDCVARLILDVREREVEEDSDDWLEKRRSRIEQAQGWGLPVCVIVAAKTVTTLHKTERGLRYVAAGLMGRSKFEYFAKYGTGFERMFAYNKLLLVSLAEKATPIVEETDDFTPKQMENLNRILRFLCQEIDQAIGRIWPGLYIEDAQRILNCVEVCV